MHQRLFEEQLVEWPLAAENYQALAQIRTKDFFLDGHRFRLQCNPNRLSSSTANISKEAIQERPCFLCKKNRPLLQKEVLLEDFTILVNPFPVFPRHFTIANGHQPQALKNRFGVFLRIARAMDDCVIFYNGPKCGASAPDHLHFQAGNKGSMPLETDYSMWHPTFISKMVSGESVQLLELKGLLRGGWLLEGKDEHALTILFERIYAKLNTLQLSEIEEPMMNVLCWFSNDVWHCIVFPRKAHRPSCYFRDDAEKLLISPASVEMGGLVVVSRLEDFERITEDDLRHIYAEVSLEEKEVSALTESILNDWNEPLLDVGIVSAPEISFNFPVPYRLVGSGNTAKTFEGAYTVAIKNDGIEFENAQYKTLEFEPIRPLGAHFELLRVKIGIGFHWERTEKQTFEGRLKFLVEGLQLTAVNRILLESYLTSVISSEMSANASTELLKAHAVISRSWLLAQIRQRGKNAGRNPGFIETENERIKWYDREEHTLYEVCADDHCQRYQGITKASTPQVMEAIRFTRGQVLLSEGEICDARFSKCCGGALETFENCWENEQKPYLQGLADTDLETVRQNPNGFLIENLESFSTLKNGQAEGNELSTVGENQRISFPDLRDETNAREWIMGNPPAFCNTRDKHILNQVLNNYDQETIDFFRWEKSYTRAEISQLAKDRSDIDFGEILELIPVERGVSGRLVKLRIVGTKRSLVLGKELEIRRTFSTSHLYSSAFVVEKTDVGFVLHGAGWGHGVGLCQIGAAVMGERGYGYKAILSHYYPNTELVNKYL